MGTAYQKTFTSTTVYCTNIKYWQKHGLVRLVSARTSKCNFETCSHSKVRLLPNVIYKMFYWTIHFNSYSKSQQSKGENTSQDTLFGKYTKSRSTNQKGTLNIEVQYVGKRPWLAIIHIELLNKIYYLNFRHKLLFFFFDCFNADRHHGCSHEHKEHCLAPF